MRVIIQRVSGCFVSIKGEIKSNIGTGLLVLAGFENEDSEDDLLWISRKISGLRIFNDEEGVMNLSIKDISGEILLVSQFTLHAKTKKGNRPSYIKAAKPEIAVPLYEKFIKICEKEIGKEIKTGEFGADMQISLINDGPVTIILDSKNKDL
ncbi:MAG: D-tyrosyl-tRNA(Tyr) deacylase [Bacteroidetes bacterium]|nr:MAG: D-tyrosyl-tRNA(Tyr) deacylase [Bacteroidota bacterium]